MRLESVSLIALVAIGSGLVYAWWIARRRSREPDLERDRVLGRAAVTGVTHEAGGAIRIAYRFRHPFTGESHDGAGTLPEGHAAPAPGNVVEIAYLADDPGQSCLAAELERPAAGPPA